MISTADSIFVDHLKSFEIIWLRLAIASAPRARNRTENTTKITKMTLCRGGNGVKQRLGANLKTNLKFSLKKERGKNLRTKQCAALKKHDYFARHALCTRLLLRYGLARDVAALHALRRETSAAAARCADVARGWRSMRALNRCIARLA